MSNDREAGKPEKGSGHRILVEIRRRKRRLAPVVIGSCIVMILASSVTLSISSEYNRPDGSAVCGKARSVRDYALRRRA